MQAGVAQATPPTRAMAVALAARAGAERPVSGKGGVTGVHMIAEQAVAPGRLV